MDLTIFPALYEIWTICLDVALMTSNSNNDDNYLQACRPSHRLLIRCSAECGQAAVILIIIMWGGGGMRPTGEIINLNFPDFYRCINSLEVWTIWT